MEVLKLFFLFALCKSALSEENILHPCKIKDMDCLSSTTQSFLGKTCAGIPAYNIKAIDPLVISELTYEVPQSDLVFHFKNITVTGLKNQKIADFRMDRDAKSVVLQTRVDANIVADMTVEIPKLSKSFTGTYYAKTTALVTSKYNYELIPNKDGVEYFEVGPETITCETLGTPEVTLDSKLMEAISTDPDTLARKNDYEKRSVELRRDLLSVIMAKSYITVIHNLRAAARVFPKTAFFIDI
ncbi:juvenile hormone-binding protein-like [Ostrinia furnacalis]|uniref:juvenile hormone-binding protein-like n=1 Tax=Ostrinia furnacalis TaxID=93504 RepID=UPI0010405627|nr:juvenile hormone-binding protein-like [Ostrinia furnacalis]